MRHKKACLSLRPHLVERRGAVILARVRPGARSQQLLERLLGGVAACRPQGSAVCFREDRHCFWSKKTRLAALPSSSNCSLQQVCEERRRFRERKHCLRRSSEQDRTLPFPAVLPFKERQCFKRRQTLLLNNKACLSLRSYLGELRAQQAQGFGTVRVGIPGQDDNNVLAGTEEGSGKVDESLRKERRQVLN